MRVRTYNIFTTHTEVSKIINAALAHLPAFDFDYRLSFERVGQGTFDNQMIGAVTNGPEHKITVNLDWYEAADNQDLHYILWHETRHLYQWSQIEKMHLGLPIQDDVSVVQEWEYNIHHYIYNTKDTETAHMKQEMEIDAYAFAVYMLAHYFQDAQGNIRIGLPPMIEADILDRVEKSAKYDCNIFKRIV